MNNARSIRLRGVFFLATVHTANAQQLAKVARVGMLVSGSVASHGHRIAAFRQGLRDFGYVEGNNIVIEYRYADGRRERFDDLAIEMVGLKPDVIYVGSTGFTQAAKKATNTIPIVSTAGDLVKSGLVASLAQPGGNLTGSTNISPDISGKRLELLKETLPRAQRVAALYHPNRDDEDEVKQTEIAANALRVAIYRAPVKTREEFAGAFAGMRKERVDALVVIQGSVNNSNIK